MLFTFLFLFFWPNVLADKEELENSSLTGSRMSIRILKQDRMICFIWYAKHHGQFCRMINRGHQINRILKRDGQLSGISKRIPEQKTKIMLLFIIACSFINIFLLLLLVHQLNVLII